MSASSCNSCEPVIDRSRIANLVKQASSSFYWAMRILQKPKRDAIFAVYAFCRAVDDVADGPIELEVKHTALANWREEINALYRGTPKFSIVQALKQPVKEFDLREEDFLAVIDGMQMDADGPIIAPSRQQLDLYCDRVASAVGRLCVGIFGEPGDKGLTVAYHQGRALQLTNILRDVAEDADDGRLYLPREYLDAHNIAHEVFRDDPRAVMDQPGFSHLWRQLADEAEEQYQLTYAALGKCDRRKMRASYIMAEIYHLNLKRMKGLSDAQLSDPKLNKRLVGKVEKLAIAVKNFRG